MKKNIWVKVGIAILALLIGLAIGAVFAKAVTIETGVQVTSGNVTYDFQNDTNMTSLDVRSDGVSFGPDDLNVTAPSGTIIFDVLTWSPLVNSFTALSSTAQTLSVSFSKSGSNADFITGGNNYPSFYNIGTSLINWYYGTLLDLNITDVTTIPVLPTINDGTAQNITVNFSSSSYPLNITFIAYHSNGSVADTQGPTTINNASELPTYYEIPDTLSDDVYTLNMSYTYPSGFDGGEITLGTFTVSNIITQCNDGIDNDGDAQLDTSDEGCHTDGNAGNPLSYNPYDDDERYCGDGYVDTNEECDGSANCETDCTLETISTGGGGGGSSTYTEPDTNKVNCDDMKIVPTEITITNDLRSVVVSIKNNENFAWTPEFTLEPVLGYEDISPRVEIEEDIDLMLPRDTESFTVAYRPGIAGTIKAEGAVDIVMFSDECLDIRIPLKMNVTEQTYFSETTEFLLADGSQWWTGNQTNATVVQRIQTVMSEPIVEEVSWANSWLLLLAFAMLYLAVLWGKVFIRRDDVLNGMAFTAVWLVLSILTTIVVNVFVQSILFG